MFESRYGKFITALLIILIIVILAVLGYLGYRVIKTLQPGEEERRAAERFENQFNRNNQTNNNVQDGNIIDVIPNIAPENEQYNNEGGSQTKTQTYKGFVMVGTIEIPKISLKCPVLERASSDAIEVAVGIYAGPGLNKVGNTVIAGHNYRNGTFFSNNKKLLNGDKIYITDTTGKKVTYTIYNVYTTAPEDLNYVTRDTKGKREISLTTCTDDTKNRLIIWASAD